MKNILLLALPATFMISCSNSENSADTKADTVATNIVDSTSTPINDAADFKFKMVIGNLPSPFETIDQLKKSGLEYKKELLNDPANESKYITTTKKALNYGVYGVDLGYLASNKDFGKASKYFGATRNLAVSLDAVESFDKIVGSRIQSNMENADTINMVMDEAFAATDSYLRSAERQLAATQMLTGSWVESQYIALNSLSGQQKNEKNDFLFQKVYEQKLHLGYLCDLLKEYEKEKEFLPVINALKDLNEDFKKIGVLEDVTPDKVTALASKITKVREQIVK
jgi:hypothetical protein